MMHPVIAPRRVGRSCLATLAVTAAAAALLCAAAPAHATTYIQGIDVYNGDGAVNWNSVKSGGYDFAFVKATEGVNFIDARFATNMTNANSGGVYVGPYHLARPDSKNGVPFTTYNGAALAPDSPTQTNRDAWADATSEASDFLAAIRPYYQQTGNTHYLPPVADLELSKIPSFGSTALDKTFVSNWVQIFSDAIEDDLGVRPFMYLSKSNANTYWTSTIASEHAFWIAQYKGTGTTAPPTVADTPLWPAWSFWQWSDGTDAIAQGSLVPGVSVSPDRDVFSGTSAQLAAMRLQVPIPEPSSLCIFLCAGGLVCVFGRTPRRSSPAKCD
jgi:GH25 family lysozyme M1 (1,4-beta-N-acetylmuramidase)